MLVWLMLLCGAVAVLVIVLEALTEFTNLWTHPDHRLRDEDQEAEKHRASSGHGSPRSLRH